MEWFRGDSGGRGAGALTAALGEIDGIFRPARKEQLALIEEQKRRRIDDDSADDGRGIVDLDLERGVAVVRIGRRGDQAV
jgi:hypothetical protein